MEVLPEDGIDVVLDRGQRIILLVLLAPVFLFILPYLFIRLGAMIDQWLQWPPMPNQPFNLILGFLLLLPGLLFGLWSNNSQFNIGRGTPVPLMATQKLIIQPPYSYCRNPMALGAIGMYLGVAILFRSIGAVTLVTLFAGSLLTYIKLMLKKKKCRADSVRNILPTNNRRHS